MQGPLRLLPAGFPYEVVEGKRDVRSHLPEQFDLLLVKKVLFVRVEGQCADHPAFLFQGNTRRGANAVGSALFMPWTSDRRTLKVIADVIGAFANRYSGWPDTCRF